MTIIRVGTAGWSLPAAVAERLASGGTHLQRYAAQLPVVEINSSFYRPHRRTTYERWAASVPADFRFSVKLPKAITHECRLRDCMPLVERFGDEIAGLGQKLGPVLVQLPPSFAFPGDIAEGVFEAASRVLRAELVLEPRHASWFSADVDLVLDRQRVSRVAADPARIPAAAVPGGWNRTAYFRLHGSPRIYDSPYSPDAIRRQSVDAALLAGTGAEVWIIYDNTMHGAATQNALDLEDILRPGTTRP
ncbi:hypothetical protein Sa4125_05650 [Aureimonas sp. SA4125]|uniref:DUF72 domain-containing protein n=1 Tax=Aureimonas sp. SA4125 TaxID=2826993 RepID=UPI001CC70CCD|nr:DUF72 domain-containing protein [Aureimonas sp. SA4125]BDA83023.1 hypothetical protein Sa4125_05650 [Aureimonas sp. SA4125]